MLFAATAHKLHKMPWCCQVGCKHALPDMQSLPMSVMCVQPHLGQGTVLQTSAGQVYTSVCTIYVVMIGLLYKADPEQVLLNLRPYPVRGHRLLCIIRGSVCTSMCQLQVIGAFLLLRLHCSLQPLPPSLATPTSSHHNPPPHPSKQPPWPGQAQQP